MARRALLIGVSEYGEGFDALPGSLLDVQGMAAVLGNAEQGAFDELKALENPERLAMEAATGQFFQDCAADDLLLFYFSGHGDLGVSVAQQQLHFCVKGSQKAGKRLQEWTAMSAEVLKRQMSLCKSRQIVVILDCCYSGAIADLLRKGEAGSAFDELKAEGRVILASSSASESSWQMADGLSLYTRYLLEGMAGPAQSEGAEGKWIVARELHDYAKQKLAVEQKGGLSPEIIVARKAGYDVAVVRAPKADPLLEYRRAVDELFQELDEELGLRFDGVIKEGSLEWGVLDTRRQRLGVNVSLARQIESKVQSPYLARAKQRGQYRQYFEQGVGDGFLPSERSRRQLDKIRQNLLLGEEDASEIEQLIVQERQIKVRPVTAPKPPKPKPRTTPVPREEMKVEPLPRPAAEPEKQQRQAQTATLPRKPKAPAKKVPGQLFPRRVFLRTLGFGGVGLGLVGLWRGLSGLGLRGRQAVTVDAKGEILEQQPVSVDTFQEDLGNGVELEMVRIPAGKFMMGSPVDEEDRLDHEGPQHEVTVPEFAMGRFEVTQVQYEAVMGENPANFKGDQRPVEQVSWNDAQAFCKKLSERTGRDYRLPSEAEWEYACRGGTTTPFHVGETITPDLANYDGNYSYADGPKGAYREQTTDVGSFLPNVFGLSDMHGNVFEWCADRWHSNYEGAPTDGSAWIADADDKELYVLRGGSWIVIPGYCRSAYRYSLSHGYRDFDFGFRVVCVVSPGLF